MRRHSSPSTDSSHNRKSWEDHSEEETLQLQDLPKSITPQSLWKEDVAIDLENSDDSQKSGDEEGPPRRKSDSDSESQEEMQHNNWEVQMLAQELEARRRSSHSSSSGS